MKKGNIEYYVEIIDMTSSEDDPYDSWKVQPSEKFIEELLDAGYEYDEIYNVTLEMEEGILVDYNLFPREELRWDDEEKNMKLKMKYVPLIEYKKALEDLGVICDEKYWNSQKVHETLQ